jgi:hypothetical protein
MSFRKTSAAITIGLSLLAGSAMVGCNQVSKPIQGRFDPYEAPQISFADKSLARQLAVGVPVTQRDSVSQHLIVTVPIRAATNKTLYVDYSGTFIDQNGLPVSSVGPLTKTFNPNVPDSIVIQSTSPNAADFQLTLRWAR